MEGFFFLLRSLSMGAAELLVSSVWESVVLIGAVALLLRCIPRLSPGTRSCIWTTSLVLTLLLPIFSLRTSLRVSPGAEVWHASEAWSLFVAGAWLLLSLLRLAQLGGSALRLHSILRRAVPAGIGAGLAEVLDRGPRRVQVCVSDDVSRPSVAGFSQPRILLPAGLLEELSESDLEHVLLHELEHLRRRDDWTNLLQKIGLALLPLHPAMFWLDRRMCVERELACDDRVLQRTRGRKAYAACLARLAEDSMVRRGLLLALGLLGGRARTSELSVRVHRILRSPTAVMGRTQAVATAAVVIAAVLGGAMLLARSPRLIRFDEAASESLQAADRPDTSPALPKAASHPNGGALPFAIPVKAIVPAMSPQLVQAGSPAVRGVRARRHLALARQDVRNAPQYVIYTTWRQQVEVPHLTLAVAADFQSTYAAVPVRGGWLFFQL